MGGELFTGISQGFMPAYQESLKAALDAPLRQAQVNYYNQRSDSGQQKNNFLYGTPPPKDTMNANYDDAVNKYVGNMGNQPINIATSGMEPSVRAALPTLMPKAAPVASAPVEPDPNAPASPAGGNTNPLTRAAQEKISIKQAADADALARQQQAQQYKTDHPAALKSAGKADAKADDYITNIGRELTAQANVFKLGQDNNLFETNLANTAANTGLHSFIGTNPLTQGIMRSNLPKGAMQFNADNENAGLALAKVVGGGRPNEFVQKTLQGHRATIGGGIQQAQEAYNSSIDAARAEAEGQIAKIYMNDPAKAAIAKDKLENMFGDFKPGGTNHPFASATYQTGLQIPQDAAPSVSSSPAHQGLAAKILSDPQAGPDDIAWAKSHMGQ